jgi:hypothetical protein
VTRCEACGDIARLVDLPAIIRRAHYWVKDVMQSQESQAHPQFLALVGDALKGAAQMRLMNVQTQMAAAIRDYCGRVGRLIEASFVESDSMTQEEIESNYHLLKGLLSEQIATLKFFHNRPISKLPQIREAIEVYAEATDALADRVEDFEDSINIRDSVTAFEDALHREM